MKTKLLILTLLPFVAPLHAASVDAAALVTASEPAIERAYLRGSESALAEAAKPLDAALAADPKNPALLYERAFAHYATLPSLRLKKDHDAMQAELEKAAALLGRVKGQPWEAEAAALHSATLGQLIAIQGGMSGMTLGPKSNQLIARAAKALSGNPRVLLFQGISLLNTPAIYGGDPAERAKLLQQSVDAFAKEDGSAPGPHWGRADALTWLGLARQHAGDLAAARTAWQQALALEPDYAWVKFALLPSLPQPTSE